jgi:hypothetical protein
LHLGVLVWKVKKVVVLTLTPSVRRAPPTIDYSFPQHMALCNVQIILRGRHCTRRASVASVSFYHKQARNAGGTVSFA